MVEIGYHCSHEQFAPSELLRYVQAAERAGFTAAMSSDHFYPWSERQGQSGFAWSWLGAALQATSFGFGVVNAPGQRYHPAIIAQAAATLAEMFPGRFWLALGTGQYANEHITGEPWPPKHERNARLQEAVEIMRALWAGEEVTHRGYFTLTEAKLYTQPAEPPLVVGAAVTAKTAAWVATWADAAITVYKPAEEQKKWIDAFRRGGGAGKPIFLQAQTSYAPTDQAARQGAWEQWRTNVFPSQVLTDLPHPRQFDMLAKFVRPADLDNHIRISSSVQQHVDWLGQDIELGFERIYLHNTNREQAPFIETFGAEVIPQLLGAARP